MRACSVRIVVILAVAMALLSCGDQTQDEPQVEVPVEVTREFISIQQATQDAAALLEAVGEGPVGPREMAAYRESLLRVGDQLATAENYRVEAAELWEFLRLPGNVYRYSYEDTLVGEEPVGVSAADRMDAIRQTLADDQIQGRRLLLVEEAALRYAGTAEVIYTEDEYKELFRLVLEQVQSR